MVRGYENAGVVLANDGNDRAFRYDGHGNASEVDAVGVSSPCR